jgi:putative restriction endonuclease
MAYGDIGTIGKTYSRAEIVTLGIHRNPRGGIQGSKVRGRGAESVLATGGYEDDVDLGHTILYTGQGGQHADTRLVLRPQVADQELKGLNATLASNVVSGEPVRVIRAAAGGYRYDGLFRVVSVRDLLGKSGFRIWQFELHELLPAGGAGVPKLPAGKKKGPAPRVPTGPSDRIIRDTKMAQDVKRLHDYQCQVCGVRLVTRSGGYAEGAHIVA